MQKVHATEALDLDGPSVFFSVIRNATFVEDYKNFPQTEKQVEINFSMTITIHAGQLMENTSIVKILKNRNTFTLYRVRSQD